MLVQNSEVLTHPAAAIAGASVGAAGVQSTLTAALHRLAPFRPRLGGTASRAGHKYTFLRIDCTNLAIKSDSKIEHRR